jgi:hypothetical protein
MEEKMDIIAMVAGIVQTLLYADFFWGELALPYDYARKLIIAAFIQYTTKSAYCGHHQVA